MKASCTDGKIRVAVLTSSYALSSSPTKDVDDFDCGPHHYFAADDPKYSFEKFGIDKATSYATLRALVRSEKFDVFFNLCDGARDEDRAGEDVVRALEEFQVPFTGADSKHFDPTKPDMKMIAHYSGVKTPKYFVIKKLPTPEQLTAQTKTMRFPLIVKHPQGFASIGMSKNSKCATVSELLVQVTYFVTEFHAALVEEFITGDEATVLAFETPTGTRVLVPVKVKFPPGEDFKHFDLKWKECNDMTWEAVPETDPAYEEMCRVAKVTFDSILGGIGYGRCDIRIDRVTNEVYLLEINPNCGVLYPPGDESSADWILKLDKTYRHRDFVISMIEAALLRAESKRRTYEVVPHPNGGYSIVAARPLPKGTIVFRDEGKAFPIVTRPHVMQHWSEKDRETFSRYAWPLSSDGHVYAIWEDDHTTWRPINHSCDPNLMFVAPHSLNNVAVRDIEEGEELTMDYATFCDGTMQPFDCMCKTAKCRGRISVTEEALKSWGGNAWHRCIPTNI